MVSFKLRASRSLRYDPGNRGLWESGDYVYLTRKGERMQQHITMLRDNADGSHNVIDAVILMGRDSVRRRPKARLILTIGKHAGINHGGDFHPLLSETLRFAPLVTTEFDVIQFGEYVKGVKETRVELNAVTSQLWAMFNRAKKQNFWMPLLGKRKMRKYQPGMPHDMRYWQMKSTWGVPDNAKAENRRKLLLANSLKKAAAWAFEDIEAVKGAAQ
jgi:hypothetical protein